jgi:hypothetical protein
MDIELYGKIYDDLKKNSSLQLIRHFITHGKIENRIYNINTFYEKYPIFDWVFYIMFYPDLQHFNEKQAIIHYLNFGRYEMRTTYNLNYVNNIQYIIKNHFHESLLHNYKFMSVINTEYYLLKHSRISIFKNDLLILIPVWNRLTLLTRCLYSLNKYKSSIILVVSNINDIIYARHNKYNYIVTINTPLGRKKNNALKFTSYLSYKYCLFVDSDDLISEKYINNSIDTIRDGLVTGSNTQLLITKNNIIYRKYIGQNIFGSGRLYTKILLDYINYKLYDDNLYRTLDKNSTNRLLQLGIEFVNINIPIISFYNDTNLTTLNTMIKDSIILKLH